MLPVATGLSSVLTTVQYVMYFRFSGFSRFVIIAYMARSIGDVDVGASCEVVKFPTYSLVGATLQFNYIVVYRVSHLHAAGEVCYQRLPCLVCYNFTVIVRGRRV